MLQTKPASYELFDGRATSFPSAVISTNQGGHLGKWRAESAGRAHVHPARDQMPGAGHPMVDISPTDSVKRRATTWHGMTAEIVQATSYDRTEYRFLASGHVLVVVADAAAPAAG